MSTAVSAESRTAESVRWDLAELFSGLDDPRIEEVLKSTQEKADLFSKEYKGNLATLTPARLLAALQEKETLITPLYKLSQYIHLLYAIDTADDPTKALLSKIEELSSRIGNTLLFFELELGQLSDAILEEFLAAPELDRYQYLLKRIQDQAKYTLSEKEEQLANLKDLTGIDAFRKLYTELTSSFMFDFEIDGKSQRLNGSQLRALRQHPDPKVRRAAMAKFFGRYADNDLIITHIYNNVVKSFNIERSSRGYSSPISVMNTNHDLPDAAVATLHEVTTASNHLVERYYKIKSKLIGLEDMTLADIYAPLPELPKTYAWDDTKNMVLESFANFDSEFHDLAKRMFDENRIDAAVLPKKTRRRLLLQRRPRLGSLHHGEFFGQTQRCIHVIPRTGPRHSRDAVQDATIMELPRHITPVRNRIRLLGNDPNGVSQENRNQPQSQNLTTKRKTRRPLRNQPPPKHVLKLRKLSPQHHERQTNDLNRTLRPLRIRPKINVRTRSILPQRIPLGMGLNSSFL